MNLLLTATAYPPSIGGAQLYLHQLAQLLATRHAVEVVTQWTTNRTDWLLGTTLKAPKESRNYSLDGISVHQITLPAAERRRLAPWVLGYYAVQSMALAQIAAALREEMAPFAETAELIHNCRIGREGLSYASFHLARKKGVPFVFTPLHHPRWGTWLHRHYHRLYREADAVIALTETERQICIALGAPARRVHVTGMGPVLASDHQLGRFRQLHALGQTPLILFLGQKLPYKGVAPLLQAARLVWQKAPETCFAFIGPRTSYSKRLFSDVRDRRVLELDTVSLQEKTEALADCDVLCVPSSQESFGGVLTEAWTMGKPVIAGDCSATREVVTEGVDGHVVKPRPELIAERLLHLLDKPRLRAQLGANGQAKVAARYAWPRLAELTADAYEKALEGRR